MIVVWIIFWGMNIGSCVLGISFRDTQPVDGGPPIIFAITVDLIVVPLMFFLPPEKNPKLFVDGTRWDFGIVTLVANVWTMILSKLIVGIVLINDWQTLKEW